MESLIQEMEKFDFSSDEKENIAKAFEEMDTDGNGQIDADEIGSFLALVNCKTAQYKIRMMLEESDLNKDGKISVYEFLKMYEKLNKNKYEKEFKKAVTAKAGIKSTQNSTISNEGTQHSYSEEETAAFSHWIYRSLKDDPDCKTKVQNLEGDELFGRVNDGILLCKLINKSVPETIDERAINKKGLNIYRKQENLNLVLNSASSIGCSIVNIRASDIGEGKPHLVLGLLWQVIRIGLFSKIDLFRTPELAALLQEGEELEDLMNLSPDELLLRWMNYHLANSKTYQILKNGEKVKNFSSDIKDSIAYACLLEQIQPRDEETNDYALMPPITADTSAPNDHARAEKILKQADRLGCREFVTADDIVKGNAKLNMAFVANLFNTHPALNYEDFDQEIIEETREVKTFRNWMNSLGVSPRVNKFNRDLGDGLVLLQLYGHIKKDIVDWNKVNTPPYKSPGENMKKRENCQYAIKVGKQLGYKIIGIDGNNLYDGDEMATLAVVWQLMRGYTLKILERISYDGKAATDPEIVNWVNTTLEKGGKDSRVRNFKDSSISTSRVVLDLIDSISPGSIDYAVVTDGESEEDKFSNAKYAVSMARKIGARVYALPEDLVEVKPKMVLTMFACLMGRGLDNVNTEEAAAQES